MPALLGRRPGFLPWLALLLAAWLPSALEAEESQTIDLQHLRHGAAAFPTFWRPYGPMSLPPVDLKNGPQLERRIADGRLSVSLREFLQLVVENNLDLHAARYDYVIAQVDVLRARSGQAARGVPSAPLPAALFAGAIGAGVSSTAALSSGGTGGAAITTQGKLVAFGPRGIFDPTLSLNLSFDRLVNPLNTKVVAGADSIVIPTTVLQTRYQQELPYGTSYSVSFNLQRQRSTQAGLLFNPALSSFLALQAYQPLLNGFGLALTQRFVTLADNNKAIVREAFHSTLNTALSDAANAYWDLVALRENVKVAELATRAARQQANEDQQRVELGTMTPIDVLNDESQLASARVQLVIAQTKVQQQEVALRALISRTGEPALDAAVIEPTDALPTPAETDVPSLRGSIETALANRSSIRQAQLSLQNQHIAMEYTRKNLLPILSVYGALNMYGIAPGTDPALRQLIRLSYPEFAFGFTWSMPVFNRAAQADDVRARLEAQQAEATLQQTKSLVSSQVQTAIINLTQVRAQARAAERAVVASQRALEGEEAREHEGLSLPFRVLLAQRDLIAAQSAEIQAKVSFAKAQVSYQVALGSFLERQGISADDAQRGTLWRDSKEP